MLDQLMAISAQQGTRGYNMLEPYVENFSNYGTYGYKARRFEMYLRPEATSELVARTDVSQGALEITRRPFDVGIQGPGYIPVTRKNGDLAYTRNGSFLTNGEGYLVTPFGDMVGNGIKIPADYHQVKIHKNGEVMLIKKPGDAPEKLGQIPLVLFNNAEGLKIIGYNLVEATEQSGKPQLTAEHDFIRQGMLERTNMNIPYNITDILRLNTGITLNQRIIKISDEIYREGINLRQ